MFWVFCGVCVALSGRCRAVCNLQSWELCILRTGMVHLQTGRSTELFINCKFLFSPLRKAFLPQVWETKFQRNSFGNLMLLKIQKYFATFLKHQSRSLGSLKPPCSLSLRKISLILPSFTLLAWSSEVFILFVDLCSYFNFLFWFPQQHILENEFICPFCRFKFGVES